MNCPFHILIYKSRMRSYRDLPLRWAELGTVYRYERSGTLHGLLRVRGFTQDDAHIFCTPEQIDGEILRVLDFSLDLLRGFGFQEFKIELSVRDPATPEKYAGEDAMWEQAEASLVRALETRDLPYERMEGEAVFYGPKIDIKIRDALNRTWQCTTIQFDFNLPRQFDMTYVGEDGKEHQPYMVHRALLGSLERFFGVLVEHYGGAFPVWLSPVQAVLIPITDRHVEYAHSVEERLRKAGLRVEVNTSDDRMQAKIRDAQMQKIPYMLVVGDREVAALEHFSPLKRLLQRWGSWVVERASGIPIPDATSGFRAFTREAALRLTVLSDYTYTLETLIQAGARNMRVLYVPIRTNPQTRQSRLIRSIPSFMALSVVTIVRFYIMYRPMRVFTTIGGTLLAGGLALGARFVYYFLVGSGAGKVQSLILAAILTIVGFQVCLIGLIADLVRLNRKMLEETLYQVRRMGLGEGAER